MAPGESFLVDFGIVDLVGGTNTLSYVVASTSSADLVFLNNFTQQLGTFPKVGQVTSEISRDFESEPIGFAPLFSIADVPTGIFVFPAGGFGTSANSVRVNFFEWSTASSAGLPQTGEFVIADQFFVPPSGASLSFDHAFTTWSGSEDKMEVQISTDCGETYTTVWSQQGDELATADEVNSNSPFAPTDDDWVTSSIDLSAYAGQTALVRFYFTTDFGDMLYLDNINVQGLSSIDELDNDASIQVYPNPAYKTVMLDMEILETTDVSLQIINVLGEVVLTDVLKSINGHHVQHLDIHNFDSGTYFLHFNVNGKEVIRRINVVD